MQCPPGAAAVTENRMTKETSNEIKQRVERVVHHLVGTDGLSAADAKALRRRLLAEAKGQASSPNREGCPPTLLTQESLAVETQSRKNGRPWKAPGDRLTQAQALNLLQFVLPDRAVDPKLDHRLKQFLMNAHAIGAAACTAMATVWLTPGTSISKVQAYVKRRFREDRIGVNRSRHAPCILWFREYKAQPPEGLEQSEHFHLVIAWSNHDTNLGYVLTLLDDMQKRGMIAADVDKGIRGWKVSTTKTASRRILYIATAWELREAYRHYLYAAKDDAQKGRDRARGTRLFGNTQLQDLYHPPGPTEKPWAFTFVQPSKKPPAPPMSTYEVIDRETGEIEVRENDSPF